MTRQSRRRFLRGVGASGAIVLAGCSGDGDATDPGDAGGADSTPTPTATTVPPSQWENTYGNDDFVTYLWGVTPTSDGGYLATGSQGSPEASQDGLMLKVDREGEEEWLETYSGPGWDWVNRPIETDDGYVGIGTKTTQAHPDGEAWLLAVEEDDDVDWERTYSDEQYTLGWGIARTEDEGYLLSARTSEDYSSFRPLVVKVDAEGDEDWRGTYLPDDASRGHLDAIVATDDGYLLTGNVWNDSSNRRNGYAIEIDASGNEIWRNRYGEGLFGRATPIDDGYLICGQAFDPDRKFGWLVNIDRDGVERWNQIYHRGASGALTDVIPAAGALSSGGSYLAVGHSKPSTDEDEIGWLLAIDDDGAKRRESAWDDVGSSTVSAVEMADNGAYVLAGWADEDGFDSDDRMAMARLVVTTEFDFGP